MPKIVGEYIDRICTVEMRPGDRELAARRDPPALRRRAREEGGEPLVSRMAIAPPGDRLGRRYGDHPHGSRGCTVVSNAEVDGVLGAVAIAKALHYGLGVEVVLMTEERAELPVRAAIQVPG